VTPKKLVFLRVLGLADCTPSREARSVATSLTKFWPVITYGISKKNVVMQV